MPRPKSPTDRRHFTEAARAAALAARLRKRELAIPLDMPEVFVVRSPSTPGQYAWEIRRFGAVVLDRGAVAYPTVRAARAGGQEALALQRIEA